MTKPLTDAACRKYAPGKERRRIRDGGARSLYLVIEPSNHRAFQMRFRTTTGRIAKLTLGPLCLAGQELEGPPQIGQPLTLAAARLLAAKVLQDRASGRDPAAEHKARKHRQRIEIESRDANMFAACVRAYIEEHARVRTRNWHWSARVLGLHYGDGNEPEVIKNGLVARWGDRPVASIDAADIWSVIDEARRTRIPGLGVRNHGLSEARARSLFVAVSSFFGWAMRHRRRLDNPCRGVPRPSPALSRERVLTNDDVRWFWLAADEVGGPFTVLLKLLLLTGARLNEVAGMTRDELHDDGTWRLPASRTKNKKPHVVPLAPVALDLIESVPTKPGNFVFATISKRGEPTHVTSWSRTKQRLDKEMLAIACKENGKSAVIEPWRLHDLRRTAATGMAEIGIAPHIVEACLNHISGAKASVAGIYNKAIYAPEKKAALERWAAHIEGLVAGRAAKVFDIRSGRA